MRKIFYLLTLYIISSSCSLNKESRIEVIRLKSNIFNNERNLRIYLPAQYDGQKTFKVLYINDAQNLFNSDSLRKKEDWRMDEITDSLISKGAIEPIIIVGIDNSGISNRGNEYLPWEDIYLNPPIPSPQGKQYPKFLINEVMPLIESKYKVKKGFENTGIGGFSYGGLISIYTVMTIPKHFGYLLAETPSLYVNDKKLLVEANNSNNVWPKKVYIGVGTNELALKNCNEENGDNKMAVSDIKNLMSIIKKQHPKTEVNTNIVRCATHSFEEASRRLPQALKFLYGQ